MNTTTVIYHRADFDGVFCREIARKFLPDAELIGWDFEDEPLDPGLYTLSPESRVYIIDLPCDAPFGLKFPAGQAPETASGFDKFIWIDHHASAIASHPKNIPGYRIDGVAACRLAWQWFTCDENFRPREGYGRDYELPAKQAFIDRTVSEPLAVRLAGEYDIWDKRDPDAETFQFGLRSVRDLDWSALLDASLEPTLQVQQSQLYSAPLLHNGRLIQGYQREQYAGIVKRGFDVQFEGLNFLALNIARCNSLTFESAAQPHHDGLMGFYWTGKEWALSLYHSPHHKEHDLSAIAVKYGGGGHRGACGFRVASLPFIQPAKYADPILDSRNSQEPQDPAWARRSVLRNDAL